MSRQAIALLGPLFLLASFANGEAAGKKTKSVPPPVLSEHDRALHALGRLTFGPRPGDLGKVMATGVDNWIEQQLNPAAIANPVLDTRLAGYRTLRLAPRELAQTFPSGPMIREAAEKKPPLPSDPVQFGLWEVLVDKHSE